MGPEKLLTTTDQFAIPLSAVLAARLGDRTILPTTPSSPSASTTLPVVTPDSTMQPGALYPSAGDANHLLFLPQYAVSSIALTPSALTVVVTATPPATPSGRTIAAVPHELTAKFSYTRLNEAQNPTMTLSVDFDAVSTVPNSTNPLQRSLTLSIKDPAQLGQIALAMSRAIWSPTLTLTATMPVGVQRPRGILVDKSVLFHSMLIDDATALKPIGAGDTTLLAKPPTAIAQTPASTVPRRLMDTEALGIVPLAARFDAARAIAPAPAPAPAPAEKTFAPLASAVALRNFAPANHLTMLRPIVDDGGTDPVDPVRPPIHVLPGPILNPPHPIPDPVDPPPPPPPPPGFPDVVSIVAHAIESQPLFAQYPGPAYQIGEFNPPANVFLKKVDCDGLELWHDEAPPSQDFYYLPRSFRLGVAPVGGVNVPTLLVMIEDDGGGDPSQANVALTMRLLPHLDAQDLARARAAATATLQAAGIAGPPRLSVQEPPITQLEWWIPSVSGAEQSLAMSATNASFADGLNVTLEMKYPQLQRVIDLFLVPWSAGLEGEVRYASPADKALTQSVPIGVNLRTFEGAGVALSIAQATSDHAKITLQNLLPCDVQMQGTMTALVAGKYVELDLFDEIGASLRGGFSVASATSTTCIARAAGVDLSTLVAADVTVGWEATPSNDQLAAICAQLIGGQTFAPEMVSLDVETLVGYFRAADGAKALTKLSVEFPDSSRTIDLTAQSPRGTVTLAPPLLLQLLNDPAARRFKYRVTNTYADGSTIVGADLVWEGGSPLVVEANPSNGQSHASP